MVHQQRLRWAAVASAVAVGAVAASAAAALLAAAAVEPVVARTSAIGVWAGVTSWLGQRWWRRHTLHGVAMLVESRAGSLDNLVITAAEELRANRAPVHPAVAGVLFEQAEARLRGLPPATVQPLSRQVVLAIAIAAASALVIVAVPQSRGLVPSTRLSASRASTPVPAPGAVQVTVTPPAYSGLPPVHVSNPTEIAALEGSRIDLETAASDGRMEVVEAGREPIPFRQDTDRWRHTFQAAESRVLLIRATGRPNDASRLLRVRVDPDRRPLVRNETPAKDLVFGTPTGQVPIVIEAQDDLGLRSLDLRYTRVAGSGETFTFEEGRVPVRIERHGAGTWRGHAMLTLESLSLADGDSLVYRAVATDGKPGADPSMSDSFLLEIGRLAGVSSTGFALPEERDRQAISQQMLIIKTERLHRARDRMAREDVEAQARLLAIEQRMVKAEFVFMTGGEVADEVAEAEHAHELAEGRLENAAQQELLTAIREMSRAEARLNAADTAEALTFERAALRALQRAFDRRRYLLRTLPERTRIDLTRRLSGDRSAAASPGRTAGDARGDAAAAKVREVMAAIRIAVASRQGLDATLASHVLNVDPASEALQGVAVTLAGAAAIESRVAAAMAAHDQLAAVLRARLPPGATAGIAHDPLAGRFADELARGRQ